MLVVVFFYLNPVGVEAERNQTDAQLASSREIVAANDAELYRCRQNAITRAVKQVAPAVVGINVISVREYRYRSPFYLDPFFRQVFPDQVYRKKVENLGSGFLITDDGYVLTNQHVVNEATQVVVTMTDGQKFDAQIVGFDYDTDVALLKIDGKGLPYIKFGDSEQVIIGEWSIAIGNPFGLFSIHSQPTVTVGVVSAIDRDFERNDEGRLYQDMVQTDAAINRGNSGGPLVNSAGELIGMNTMIFTEGGGSIGLGFAIPSNKLQTLYETLRNRGSIDRDFWIGLHVQDVNRNIAISLGLPEIRGVVVTDVEKSSPSEKSGIESTDVILGVNSYPVNSTSDIEQALRNIDLRVGDLVTFNILRDGKQNQVAVKLEKQASKQ
jgi:serine protease Do